MAAFNWGDFLTEWSRELLACEDIAAAVAPEAVESGWLGYPPAGEAAIAAVEARLDARLPPSFRAFLATTNGWREAGFFIHRLWPVQEIAWYAARHQDLIDAWMAGATYYGPAPPVPDEEYFVYGDRQAAQRDEYLQTALEISEDTGDGVCLLNPKVIFPDGEWEAWFFAHWIPGAHRYRSFWDLMRAERESFLYVREQSYTRHGSRYRRKTTK
jgi:hypothetical protein